MQILSVHLKNIKSHRETELHFSPGINVLSGPNGVGKSTVFEAIGYALFGVDAQKFVGNVERFISIGAKKGEITVDFQLPGGEKFRVTRTVGPGSKWLLARELGGDFEVEDHANAQETEARLKELLGLDNGRALSEQFELVIGPFQNEFLGPFILKGQKRIDAFDEILGIDAWRKTYKGANALSNEIKRRIELLNAEIEEKQIKVTELSDKQAELKGIIAAQKEKQGELKSREAALADIARQVQQLDRQKEQMDKVHNDLKQTQASLESGKEHVATQTTLVKQSEEAVTLMERNRSGREAFERAETHLEALRKQDQQRRVAEKELAELDKRAVRLTESLEHQRREIDKTKQELAAEEKQLAEDRKNLQADACLVKTAGRLADIRKELDAAKASRGLLEGKRASLLEGRDKLAEGICPFFQESCKNIAGKEPRDVFTTRVENLDQEMLKLDKQIERLGQDLCTAEKAQQELDALKVRFEGLEKQTRTLQDRQQKNLERAQGLEKLQAEKADAEAKAAGRRKDLEAFAKLDEEIAGAEKERQKHQQARDEFYRNLQTAEELSKRRGTLERYQQRLKELGETLKAQQKEFQRLNESYQPERHQNARKQKEEFLAIVATLKEQVDNLGKDQRRLEREIENLNRIKKEIEEKLAARKSFEEKEKLVQFLRNKVFRNVSAQLSERFREEISLRADRIYRTIAETDEELYWGENYQVVLRDLADGEVRERTDDQLSGGQMMSTVVALRLALLQTIGARVAFFDEPTSNLDAGRRENLAHAFRAIDVGREEVTEHWYDQLFLVSHDVAFTEITDQLLLLDR